MTAIFYQPLLYEPYHHLQTDMCKDEGFRFFVHLLGLMEVTLLISSPCHLSV